MKYPIGFCMLSILNLISPYISGPLIQANSKTMTRWGWLPRDVDDTLKTVTFSENEMRFT